MPATSLFSIIDFLGVVAGALGGALAARHNERYDYDIVGLFGLALVSALGGGITRDVLIERGPPLAFVDVRHCTPQSAEPFWALLSARAWVAKPKEFSSSSMPQRLLCSQSPGQHALSTLICRSCQPWSWTWSPLLAEAHCATF